eukprot:TRINITY_DN76382_c0_g1_i1.p1 TRINITY_DN76382_c0_g1~~TRINITY_DN76382_c0_g1_i1.p1  ORF type:complete len:686 (+),score=163.21 TRINITY_DN76382_c0_g1_i1:51-2108(+)
MAMSKHSSLGASMLTAPAFIAPTGYQQVPQKPFQASVSAPAAGNQAIDQVRTASCVVAGVVSASLASKRRSRTSQKRTLRRAEIRQLRPRDRADGHGWIKEDPEFDATNEAAVTSTTTVELKKRPSGINRYTHGLDGKGAMVAEMTEKARYPGDPIGQAAVAGVKKGMVVKAVNGTDVRSWDFEDIMDLLEDFVPDPDVNSTAAFGGKAQRPRKHQAVDFPVTIEYMEMQKSAASASTAAAPAAPPGAWMPRLEGWSDEDLAKERARALAMPDTPGYSGPRYTKPGDITDAWIQQLMQMQKAGTLLPKKDAYLIVLDTIAQLKTESTMNRVQVNPGQVLTVYGDIHGQYFDLLNMLSSSGLPSPGRPFLFNGDMVDRGTWSIEVILLLYSLKLKDPTTVFFNRGNHEMLEANLIYGFAGEVGTKYDMDLFNLFSESFRNLPLTHLINNETMVVHAGLPGPRPRVWLPGQTHDPEDAVPINVKAVTLAEIAAVDRYTELTPNSYKAAVDEAPRQEEKWETDSRMIVDFLWSDPRGGSGYGPSYRKSRGVFMFGPDVTEQFCRENNLNLVIRSHEVKAEGWLRDHDTMMSVFSAPNYLDTGGNKGAYLQLTPGPDGKLQVTPTSFTHVPHPDLPPMFHQNHIVENHPHLTRQMRKKVVSTADDFGDSDFAGYQGPDEWEEVDSPVPA